MNSTSFSVFESSYSLCKGVTAESWFIITEEGSAMRRFLYRYEHRVVAFRDIGGEDACLYMEGMFYELYKDGPEVPAILADSGVFGTSHLKFFYLR